MDTANFIELWRNQLVDVIDSSFPIFDNPLLFDTFTNYFKNSILSLNLPNFKNELANMFNSVYYKSFKLQLESSGINVPDTQNFMDCVKNNFSTPETQNILDYRFRILEPRINFLFRLIIALKTSDHARTGDDNGSHSQL